MVIGIIDYGMGNNGSIRNMLRKAGAEEVVLATTAADILSASALILPGVGHFGRAMEELHTRDLVQPLCAAVQEKNTPLLGICLGMQLLLEGSAEGDSEGLGWLRGRCHRIPAATVESPTLKVPHMGWNQVRITQPHPLFADTLPEHRYYFVHSYHAVCADAAEQLATTPYGIDLTAAIGRAQLLGVQFHPEKSHRYGLTLFQRWLSLVTPQVTR